MQPKATMNILSCCVTRDVFSIHENDGGYEIQQYVSRVHPMTFCDPPIPYDEAAYSSFDCKPYCPNYLKRCLEFDLRHDAIDRLKLKDSDWLVIDTGLFRRSLINLSDKGYVFESNQNLVNALAAKGIIPKPTGVFELENYSEEEFNRRINYYIESILSIYPPEKIILLEVKGSYLYLKSDGRVSAYDYRDDITKQNARMTKCFSILKQRLDGCHIIPFPENVIANEKHWLGNYFMHFTQEYYDYALKCIDIITSHQEKTEEEKQILELHRDCTETYTNKYHRLIGSSFALVEKMRHQYENEKNLMSKYIGYFTRLLDNNVKLDQILTDLNIHTVALYRWTRIAYYFRQEIRKTDIRLSYVVEDLPDNFIKSEFASQCADFRVLPQKTANLPEVDAILIADIENHVSIKEKLRNIAPNSVILTPLDLFENDTNL